MELDLRDPVALAAVHRLAVAAHLEARPDTVPAPLDAFAKRAGIMRPDRAERWWGLWEGSELSAFGHLRLDYGDANRHLAEADVYVAVGWRRRGLGRSVLASLAEAAEAAGRRALLGGCPERSAGAAFCGRVGATLGFVEIHSRLDVDAIDLSLLSKWAVPIEGYSLVGWDGQCPAEWLTPYAALKSAENDAPTGELTFEDEHRRPDQIVEKEQRRLARGENWWTLAARHDRSGALAGYTVVFPCPWDESLLWQGWTAVAPDHRRRGIARWLKGAMALRVLDAGGIRTIETDNEVSNRDMLAINNEMGFVPFLRQEAYQLEL